MQQEDTASAPSDAEVVAAARAIIAKAGYAALVTLDADGRPQARAMDPFPPEEDLSVWMATRRGTRKVEELQRDARALLYYFDAAGGSYVTLHGDARIVVDEAERQRRWKPAWSAFYDDENRGDDYLLIELVTERVEVVSLEHGIASGPKAWKPAEVRRR